MAIWTRAREAICRKRLLQMGDCLDLAVAQSFPRQRWQTAEPSTQGVVLVVGHIFGSLFEPPASVSGLVEGKDLAAAGVGVQDAGEAGLDAGRLIGKRQGDHVPLAGAGADQCGTWRSGFLRR